MKHCLRPSYTSLALSILLLTETQGFMTHPINTRAKTPLNFLTSDTIDTKSDVAVSIKRTSVNSRRIGGQIIVNAPMDDVWDILTDYDNLTKHVPNLIESRRVSQDRGMDRQGNGNYKCRLYQKGAQKVFGFQFGADVTMDMAECVLSDRERKIGFKCVDSMFFSAFDGEWSVSANPDGTTSMYYNVFVKPSGPVPVAALEWRIKEDVPLNMMAVKESAELRKKRQQLNDGTRGPDFLIRNEEGMISQHRRMRKDLSDFVGRVGKNTKWEDEETLAAYLPL